MAKGDQLWGDDPSPIITFASTLKSLALCERRTGDQLWGLTPAKQATSP